MITSCENQQHFSCYHSETTVFSQAMHEKCKLSSGFLIVLWKLPTVTSSILYHVMPKAFNLVLPCVRHYMPHWNHLISPSANGKLLIPWMFRRCFDMEGGLDLTLLGEATHSVISRGTESTCPSAVQGLMQRRGKAASSLPFWSTLFKDGVNWQG